MKNLLNTKNKFQHLTTLCKHEKQNDSRRQQPQEVLLWQSKTVDGVFDMAYQINDGTTVVLVTHLEFEVFVNNLFILYLTLYRRLVSSASHPPVSNHGTKQDAHNMTQTFPD